ncbi:hypothetical protein LSCM4_03180 [Leishmania orientalis]|uniref:Uncharacterized protein n=1 Tax=Leishmania orientalis TaxID=2249476 RepID=A0A836GDS3_9TRYP|nr:hypothetical protein LSCM4_03180 [Leishmania orientalis]
MSFASHCTLRASCFLAAALSSTTQEWRTRPRTAAPPSSGTGTAALPACRCASSPTV